MKRFSLVILFAIACTYLVEPQPQLDTYPQLTKEQQRQIRVIPRMECTAEQFSGRFDRKPTDGQVGTIWTRSTSVNIPKENLSYGWNFFVVRAVVCRDDGSMAISAPSKVVWWYYPPPKQDPPRPRKQEP